MRTYPTRLWTLTTFCTIYTGRVCVSFSFRFRLNVRPCTFDDAIQILYDGCSPHRVVHADYVTGWDNAVDGAQIETSSRWD